MVLIPVTSTTAIRAVGYDGSTLTVGLHTSTFAVITPEKL
jgi:hypothetical protein